MQRVDWANLPRFMVLVVLAFSCSALSVSAQGSCPELVSTFDAGGRAVSVHAVGSHAYVDLPGHRLAVIDVSNPLSPVERGSYPVVAVETVVVGGRALVASSNAVIPGLFIIDVSDPTDPTLVSNRNTGQALPYNVAVAGSYAYVGHWYGAVVIFDISDPADPSIVATHPEGFDVQVVGDYMYITERGTDPGDGLRVVDVSDPTSPVHVGGYDLTHVETLAVDYPYAYVTVTGYTLGGLHVIDISNPSAPVGVGYCADPFEATGVVVKGGYAFVTANAHGGLLASVHKIDVSDPTNPTGVGVYELPAADHTASDVSVVLPHVYLAAGSGFFRILTMFCGGLFYDGFETGDTTRWSTTVGNCQPCTDAIGCRLVNGRKIFVVPMDAGQNGTSVCADHGYRCVGAPVMTPPEAACLAFHPGAAVTSNDDGWQQAVWCDDDNGLACQGRTGCHHCPRCIDSGLDCAVAGSDLLDELFVECTCG